MQRAGTLGQLAILHHDVGRALKIGEGQCGRVARIVEVDARSAVDRRYRLDPLLIGKDDLVLARLELRQRPGACLGRLVAGDDPDRHRGCDRSVGKRLQNRALADVASLHLVEVIFLELATGQIVRIAALQQVEHVARHGPGFLSNLELVLLEIALRKFVRTLEQPA